MSNRRNRFPSLRALSAFEAASRLGSFSKAAEELGTTQSAISHQVRVLEELIGQPLFNRQHRQAVTTDAGRDLEVTARDCFARLESGLKRLHQYRKPNQVIVYTQPAFASRWLMPRLARLRAAHPDLDLWLYSTDQPVDVVRGEIHLAILPVASGLHDLVARPLFDDWLAPLCAPSVAAASPIDRAEDLLHRVLLYDERREDWVRWFAAAGCNQPVPVSGYNFSDSGLLIQAAVDGLGVALGSLVLAGHDLAEKRLVAPLPLAIPADAGWVVAGTKEALGRSKIQRFLVWLEEEADSVREQLRP